MITVYVKKIWERSFTGENFKKRVTGWYWERWKGVPVISDERNREGKEFRYLR
jgi:hypothetical protein